MAISTSSWRVTSAGDAGRPSEWATVGSPAGGTAADFTRGDASMIKLENVTKTYSPDVTALQNANFDIA